jgi:hypothetical protein
LTDQ